jgi:hypothetical protein|tara:strand:+ start:142 stop:2019 length:1878 start_codon:yes stop_codon:yes gene_type:complete
MRSLNSNLLNNKYIYLFFLSFLIFIGKWLFSYYFFNEDITIKIIFENPTDGYYYFPYVKFLSSLDLNLSFDPNIAGLKNISIPLYGVLLHSIFFKIFANYSFIILEFFFIYLFILIFFFIFLKSKISIPSSIILTLLMFLLPNLVDLFELNQFKYISILGDFYNLRFQRPLVVAPFLLIFILFLIDLDKKEIFQFRNFFFLGLILAFSFTAFYYYFVIEVLSFISFLLFKYDFNLINVFKNKIRYYITAIIIFLLFSSPFLFNMYFVEPDYSQRLCIFDLTFSRKLTLLNHLFLGLIKIEFLATFFVISLMTLIANKKKIENFNVNNIFYLIFLSSILSPFLFIIFSPKSCLVYHFTNTILVIAFFSIVFLVINFYKHFFSNIMFSKIFLLIFILFLVSSYNLKIFYDSKSKFEDENYVNYRNYLNSSVQIIKKLRVEDENLSILTLDRRLMVWAIMNGINNIKLVGGQIVPKTNEMIENDLISAFKFFNKDSNDFVNFFKNKKSGWRYFNLNTQTFFWFRYSASSLMTHKESKNFDQETLNFISKTSPLHMHSFAIPNEEFKRLKTKFTKFEVNKGYKPSIVIVNKKNFSIESSKNLNQFYCYVENKNYKTYVLKKYKSICNIK